MFTKLKFALSRHKNSIQTLYITILILIISALSRLGKRGSLVVSALAFSARGGHGFDPRGRRERISVSEHAFLSVICMISAS